MAVNNQSKGKEDNEEVCVNCEAKVLSALQLRAIIWVICGIVLIIMILAAIIYTIYHYEIRD